MKKSSASSLTSEIMIIMAAISEQPWMLHQLLAARTLIRILPESLLHEVNCKVTYVVPFAVVSPHQLFLEVDLFVDDVVFEIFLVAEEG